MKILCFCGRHNYGDPKRGLGYEYTNFLPAFKRLGHEIIFFESSNRNSYEDFADLNYQFIKTIEKEKPEIIFCVLKRYELWAETLKMVKEQSSAVLVNWATDDSWKFEQFSQFVIPFFDLYFTTYVQAVLKSKKLGYEHVFLTQWAANAEQLLPPTPAKECQWDISFIGTAYGNRPEWIKRLQNAGIKVACFGHGWQHGPVESADIPVIINKSKLCLNFGDSNWVFKGLIPYKSRQIKARVFEVPGAGGVLLTQPADNMENFFDSGREVLVFKDADDLIAKIRYYLNHTPERDVIAQAGFNRTRLEHTYDARFHQIFDKVQDIISQKQSTNQTSASHQFDYQRFFEIADKYKQGKWIRLFRKAIVFPCNVIWGKKRGPRAARRILFELSWRIAGKKTYSVSGWPGRIFYKES